MAITLDGTTGIATPGVTDTGNLSVSGTTALTVPLPVTSGGTGAASLSSISVGNLSGGSAGTIPYQSTVGTTAMLATGTAGQVLTSAGALAAPTWSTPATGALVYLSTVTASNSATVDIETTFNSTYNAYVLVASGIRPVTNSALLYCRLKIGGSYLSGSNYIFNTDVSSYGGIFAAVASGSSAQIQMTTSTEGAATDHVDFTMSIKNPASTTIYPGVDWTGANYGGAITKSCGFGMNLTTGGITGIRFLFSTGNVNAGTFRLYGIANS